VALNDPISGYIGTIIRFSAMKKHNDRRIGRKFAHVLLGNIKIPTTPLGGVAA
jgi:hypothetical protein